LIFFGIVNEKRRIITRCKESNHLKNITNLYLQLPRQHKVVISSFSIILMLLLFFPSEKATASRQKSENALQIGKRYQVAVPVTNTLELDQSDEVAVTNGSSSGNISINQDDFSEDEEFTWKTAKVKSGDSLAKIFKRYGYNARTTYDVISAKGEHSKLLKKLNVGDKLHLGINATGKLAALTYPYSKTETLHISLINDTYQSTKETKIVETRETIAHGVIKSNFWNAGIEAGLDDGQIINLANVFGWDIDFALDIRKGDSFHVVFENQYIDGDFIGTGKILAAEFINQDDPYQAIRFTDGEYYSPDGRSMRKAFLRAPVNFKYISSNFKRKRFHPVQKRWKAHRGTDYAAKTGTPVVAAGNGKVTHSTYNKYNGNYVFIQHGNGIVTKYLHFSKRKVKKGQRVKQGQLIGYVGDTGLAAGPHLHYEFLLNGVHRNPRTVKLPDAKPINKKFKTDFAQLAEQRLDELAGSRQILLTMQDHGKQARYRAP
jgi:murein DD-endopeptidase MepM/ murein hydrolase activator NlpD